MTRRGNARPGAWQHGGRAQQSSSNTAQSAATIARGGLLYNPMNPTQVVGRIQNGVLRKRVNARNGHQLKEPLAWALADEHLEQLRAVGGNLIVLTDEDGREWSATLEDFDAHGFGFQRGGCEPQHGLALSYWSRGSLPGEARQLVLL